MTSLWHSFLLFSRATPAAVALLGAHFIVYSALAWIILATRFVSARMKERELVLLETWLGMLVLELVQVAYHRGDFIQGETWGLPRYFGVYAPLLWIWLAWLCAKVWNFSVPRFRPFLPWLPRLAIVGFLGWVLCGLEYAEIKGAYEGIARQDVALAAEQVRRVIRRDYAGPSHVAAFKRSAGDYFNDRRPVVFSDFGYAAWLLRTQSEGAVEGSGACPYQDDYLFLRTSTGYAGRKTVDPAVYDLVTEIKTRFRMEKGIGSCTWRLYRRKTTPHR